MKYFVACVLIVMGCGWWWETRQEDEVVSTTELGTVEGVTGGGMWTTRVQVGGVDFPLVGDITVSKGTRLVLQQRANDARYLCDADTRSTCFKVRESKQTLGQKAKSK